MSLLSSGVAIADSVTNALGMQAKVTHGRYVTDSGTGDPTWKTTVRRGVVSRERKLVLDSGGREVVSGTNVTFVGNVPVNEGDELVLDGAKCLIKAVKSPVDVTGRLITEAYL